MTIREIHIDASNRCRVVAGPAGRTYFSTPQAVGLALLGIPPLIDAEDTTATPGILWQDYLRTNGVAFGTRGDRQVHLVTLPPTPRTIAVTHPSADGRTTVTDRMLVTFPHLFAGLRTRRGVFERGCLFLPDMTRQDQLYVGSTVPLLRSFPYGNVHPGSGHICWGGVRTADVRTIADLADLFFGSGFNHDLAEPGTIGHASLEAAIRVAPQGVLPPLGTTRYVTTVPQAIASLMGTGE